MTWVGGFPTIPSDKDVYEIDHVKRKRYFMWRRFPWCRYCKKPLSFEEATLDHIFPKRWGGTRRWNNMQILCQHCNSVKGSEIYTPEELLVLAELLEEERRLLVNKLLDEITEAMINDTKAKYTTNKVG